MIDKIGSVKNNSYTPNRNLKNQNKNQPSFQGLGEMFISLVQKCEQQPMVNVSVLDLSTAIIPRTAIETVAGSKKKDENGNEKRELNVYAGMEAFRRESSGLIVNCLIPSFIVMGAASLLQKPIMNGFGKANLANLWANEESLKTVNKYLIKAEGTGAKRLESALHSFMNDLSGIDGELEKGFVDTAGKENIQEGIKNLVESADESKNSKILFKKGYKQIADASLMTENLKLKGQSGYLAKNLEEYFEDFVKVHKAFEKEGITTAEQANRFISKAVKLVNAKSIAGLALIIPLAISMQPLNRWLTRKSSGKKGAPIYNDFADRKEDKEMSPKEKKELITQKFISIGSMISAAGLSMFMDRPVWKNIFQFKGLFPTMDQARIISTATFASRMASAEDKNELRESTIRDIATFSSFYFLGDYVAKGIATILEKRNPDIKLINTLQKRKENANILQKMWHWAKHTTIKSSEELATTKAKNLRTICQCGNILFSLLSLGVFIPLYTRAKTNKKHAEELAKQKNDLINSKADVATKSDSFTKKIIKDNTIAFKNFIN